MYAMYKTNVENCLPRAYKGRNWRNWHKVHAEAPPVAYHVQRVAMDVMDATDVTNACREHTKCEVGKMPANAAPPPKGLNAPGPPGFERPLKRMGNLSRGL